MEPQRSLPARQGQRQGHGSLQPPQDWCPPTSLRQNDQQPRLQQQEVWIPQTPYAHIPGFQRSGVEPPGVRLSRDLLQNEPSLPPFNSWVRERYSPPLLAFPTSRANPQGEQPGGALQNEAPQRLPRNDSIPGAGVPPLAQNVPNFPPPSSVQLHKSLLENEQLRVQHLQRNDSIMPLGVPQRPPDTHNFRPPFPGRAPRSLLQNVQAQVQRLQPNHSIMTSGLPQRTPGAQNFPPPFPGRAPKSMLQNEQSHVQRLQPIGSCIRENMSPRTQHFQNFPPTPQGQEPRSLLENEQSHLQRLQQHQSMLRTSVPCHTPDIQNVPPPSPVQMPRGLLQNNQSHLPQPNYSRICENAPRQTGSVPNFPPTTQGHIPGSLLQNDRLQHLQQNDMRMRASMSQQTRNVPKFPPIPQGQMPGSLLQNDQLQRLQQIDMRMRGSCSSGTESVPNFPSTPQGQQFRNQPVPLDKQSQRLQEARENSSPSSLPRQRRRSMKIPHRQQSTRQLMLLQRRRLFSSNLQMRKNLSQYIRKGRNLAKIHQKKMEGFSARAAQRLLDMTDKLWQEFSATVDRQIGEEQLFLHEHLQAESQQPNKHLIQLRQQILHLRGQSSLTDFCSPHDEGAAELPQQEQLKTFCLHLLREHEQLVHVAIDNVNQEMRIHTTVFVARLRSERQLGEKNWKLKVREWRRLWHWMLLAQSAPQHGSGDGFVHGEKRFVKGHLWRELRRVRLSIHRRLRGKYEGHLPQHTKSVITSTGILSEHWKRIEGERGLVESSVRSLLLHPPSTQQLAYDGKALFLDVSQKCSSFYTRLQSLLVKAAQTVQEDTMTLLGKVQNEDKKFVDWLRKFHKMK